MKFVLSGKKYGFSLARSRRICPLDSPDPASSIVPTIVDWHYPRAALRAVSPRTVPSPGGLRRRLTNRNKHAELKLMRKFLTLRPARSADPLRGLSIEVLQTIRRLLIRFDRSGWSDSFPALISTGENDAPCQGNTEQPCREFPSADPTQGAQDAALQQLGLS